LLFVKVARLNVAMFGRRFFLDCGIFAGAGRNDSDQQLLA
jgi:hypothetical protein